MKSKTFDRRTVLRACAAGLAFAGLPRLASSQALSGTVRIWTFLGADGQSPREVVLREIIERFTRNHPDVDVVVEAQPFQELEVKFVAASAQNRAPDVIWMRDTFLGLVQQRGALANLDDLLSAEFKTNVLPDLYPVFAEKSVFDGKRSSLPLWPSPAQAIFYRKDALAELGLEAPPLTWDEFIPVAGRLTKGDRLGFGLPTNDNSVSAFINILSGFGPSIFDATTGQFDVAGAEAKEVGNVVRQLVANGALSSTLLNAMGDDIQDQFASGRFAIVQAFAPRFQQYKQIAAAYDGNDLAVSAWPGFGDRPPAVLLGPYWTVGVSAKSANPALATAFVESLYSREASMSWAKTAGLVPDRMSALKDPYFGTPEAADIHNFTELLSAPGVMTFPQRMPDITKVFPVMNTALQELIGTDESVDAILDRAKSTLGW
ncbi:sugar ABC transporter substrate-binding protein [Aquamicrobium sp. LC103]|uniref:ABC transporter substrate-binding protein n=1 Tax=Aquamicrobium sp. LC103 TaxID=1120658 RepID=UPI0009E308E8|nr:sugar ABC transporter substrate-binding protein [Aquamicrobium sp. LC103]TKT75810.1 sugar ABC transporter substrate-binding protein [Aquamicrobium sp. LC103]